MRPCPPDINPRWWMWMAARNGSPGEPWEYIIWIGERWREWRKIRGKPGRSPLLESDHQDFDTWLERRVLEAG